MTKPTVETIDITPARAKAWLETVNTRNRRLRARKVKQYADQMTRGQWAQSGDTIRFDTDGALIDGQHRLAAVVESGHTIRNAFVVRDLPPASFRVIDSGMGRTPADALGGVSNATRIAAAARLLYVAELDGDPRKKEDLALVSRVDIAEYHAAHAEELDWCATAATRLYQAFAGGNSSAWAAFIALAHRCAPTEYQDFLESVLTGANLDAADARLALRNWLSNDRKMPNAGAHLGVLVKAWNSWVLGGKRTIIGFRDDEDFPAMLTPPTGINERT